MNRWRLPSRGSSFKKGTYMELCIYIYIYLKRTVSFLLQEVRKAYIQDRTSPDWCQHYTSVHLSQAIVNIPLPNSSNKRYGRLAQERRWDEYFMPFYLCLFTVVYRIHCTALYHYQKRHHIKKYLCHTSAARLFYKSYCLHYNKILKVNNMNVMPWSAKSLYTSHIKYLWN